jgi:hypothetical protein
MRRVLSIFCFLLLAGSAPGEDFLIPLDDRPANLLFVKQLYRVGEPRHNLTTPPRHLLGRLYNKGDCEGVIAWVEEQVKPGDTVFVSADMWLYGGLVASRNAESQLTVVQERLQRLADIGGNGVFVHVLATVPRLSLRTSDTQAPYERKLARWAEKSSLPSARELLRQHSEGQARSFPDKIPEKYVLEYLRVRERNVMVLGELIELCRAGYLDSLVLGQDDSNKSGLHRQEQKWLWEQMREAGIEDRASLVSGIDELSMVMVSGILSKRAGLSPTVRVVYSEPGLADKVPPLESLPLRHMVDQHLELAGAVPEQSEQADLDLYVYVPYSKPWKVPGEERRPASEAFVQKVHEAMSEGRQVAVADLSLVNRMDPFLAESSLATLNLPELEGFASWNTPANTVGTVVAQAVCHQIAERAREWSLENRLESEKTHQAFLLARLIDDYLYQTVVRAEVRPRAKGLDSREDPLLNLFGPVGLEVRLRLVKWAEKTFRSRYLGKRLCLLPHRREVCFTRSKLEVILPWPRLFEVEARLDIRLSPTSKDCDAVKPPAQ